MRKINARIKSVTLQKAQGLISLREAAKRLKTDSNGAYRLMCRAHEQMYRDEYYKE